MIAKSMAVAAVLAGAALALAGPASAELEPGSYSVTDGVGGLASRWMVTPCGQNCLTVQITPENSAEVHLQGNTWIGTTASGCTLAINNTSLTGQSNCPSGNSYDWHLTKDS